MIILNCKFSPPFDFVIKNIHCFRLFQSLVRYYIERHPVKRKKRRDVKSVINRLSDVSPLGKVSVHNDEGVVDYL
jgi:hypothetical protein